MNKYIKEKKRTTMSPREAFAKEDLLFLKQFPRLYVTCSTLNVSRLELKKTYSRVVKCHYIKKETLENTIKVILVVLDNNKPISDFRPCSNFRYYYDLYCRLGIMFKDNNNNIKLRCI